MENNNEKIIILQNFLQKEFSKYVKKVKDKNKGQSRITMSNLALSSFYDFCCNKRNDYDISNKNDIRELAILYIAQLLDKKFTPHSIFSFINIINSIYSTSTNCKINSAIIENKEVRDALNNKLAKLEKETKKKKDRIGMRKFKVGKYRQIFSEE